MLSVHDLKVHFNTYAGIVEALDGVTFSVQKGQTVGLVGETGCGKSVTALSILRLIPYPGKIVGGEILFNGEDLLKKSGSEMRRIRGKKISMIFQDPMTYLNPVFTIRDQIMEVLTLHEDPRLLVNEWNESNHGNGGPRPNFIANQTSPENTLDNSPKPSRRDLKKALNWKVVETLRTVKLPAPEKIANQYPHELSGGMRQRAIIAMMLATRPDLLIADEPTTALDVTIQAQLLSLLKDLGTELGLSMILITHDLGIVAENCDQVNVMYAGRIVENGWTKDIFEHPQHPYTQGLLQALPNVRKIEENLSIIPGNVPSLINPPQGCRFHPRCPYAMDVCRKTVPQLLPTAEGHKVACFLYHEA